eukprot:GHVL01041185.1.p1 GENE.GHVL01041185.1~~GHVL01041185.1.p1  ORF type:complete len:504 (+),score=51.01 GHVL01041185.1:148-1659(+)
MATGRGDNKINLDSPELSLIDSGIHSMRDVPLASHLQSINLHSNYIQRIQGLELVRNLRHLDLSANQITEISGLDGLASLKTLNLSCNLISVVEGLSFLRSLVKLNLSYNQIEDLSGLRSLGVSECKLLQLELHGNKLRSVQHVQRSAALCSSLQHLVLSQDGSSNPLCYQEGYESELLNSLPQLQTLNGVDRQGRRALPSDMVADVPELEAYLDFLLSGASTNASSSSENLPPNLKTPKIDEVLDRFRVRGFEASLLSSTTPTDADSKSGSRAATPGRGRELGGKSKTTAGEAEQDARLTQLESELKRLQLSQRNIGTGARSPLPRSPVKSCLRDSGDTEEELEPVRERGPVWDLRQRPQQKKSNLGPSTDRKKGPATSASSQQGPQGKRSTVTKSRTSDGGRKRSKEREVSTSSSVTSQPGGQRSGSDQRHREELQTTYVQLLKDLEGERERRWKAEQAARKLADHVKELQSKCEYKQTTKLTNKQTDSRTHARERVIRSF